MNETFSKNLRKLRLEKKLTQEQVAEKLGVSAQAVSRWETSVTFPDIMLLPEISRLYGVLVDDLFKDDLQGYDNLAQRLLAVYEDTYKHEDFMTAYLEYERMVKEGSMEAADYRGYGWLHMRMFQICKMKTLEYFGKALELSKDTDRDFYYHAKIGMVCFRVAEAGDGQKCIEEQLQAVKEEPENAGEWVCLADAYYNAKQYEECYRVVKDVIARFPEETYIYCIAGDVCKELKKYDDAYMYWEKHLELNPKMVESLVGIAECHEELGEYEKAYETWMRMVDKFVEWKDDIAVGFPMRKAEECKEKMGKNA